MYNTLQTIFFNNDLLISKPTLDYWHAWIQCMSFKTRLLLPFCIYFFSKVLFSLLSTSKECREGWYSVDCSQQCAGHCRDGATCNHVTGLCDGGCDVGWTGYFCENGKLVFGCLFVCFWCLFSLEKVTKRHMYLMQKHIIAFV